MSGQTQLAVLLLGLAFSACSAEKHGPLGQHLAHSGGTGGTGAVVEGDGGALIGEGGAFVGEGGAFVGEGGASFDTGSEGICSPDTEATPDSQPSPGGPIGRLDACLGQCPNGQCDSHGSPFEPGCAVSYQCWVDELFPFCNSGESITYCLLIGVTPTQESWLISCDGSTPTFEHCTNSCAAADGQTYSCL